MFGKGKNYHGMYFLTLIFVSISLASYGILPHNAFGDNVTVPSAPQNLQATAVSSSQINLLWSAPSNNRGSPVTGYEIDRSADGGTTWNTIVSNTGTTATTYSDTNLTPNTP